MGPIHCFRDCKKTVILEDDGFRVAEGGSDVFAFCSLFKGYAAKAADSVVSVESVMSSALIPNVNLFSIV